MIKLLTIFVLFLALLLNTGVASEKNYGKLTEISLQEGLNEFQKEAAKLLISDAPVDLDKAIHLTSL